ncbi:glycosyltransferase family 2 protein [Halorubrum ezzemoulense]|uniref:glycosyltransferase family 2 protein n=1 Tax=Halorubrum ezzemoulense TaxID=337243 RepID=UPI00232CE8EE|nr:glycosyltransferase family 2 protein [Halorubrum ezzemoulense]MDB9281516.1 glycosyltransferase family 2 protein [Halorubrum ezzemoulense]MDB9285046.1 glycosyltransferase family 2 protein [Halorubrum ezzemoulense]
MVTVSVVIPTYNRADVLPRAIESVLNQTYSDFEIIVVDDGSTDNTEEVVTSYTDDRVEYIPFSGNEGANAARNEGIRQSNGKYISFLDSDDKLLPTYFEECVVQLDNSGDDIGAVFTSFRVYEDGSLSDITVAPSGRVGFQDIIEENSIGGFSCITIKRSVFESIEQLDEDLPSSQDYDFFIRLLNSYDAIGIEKPLLEYYLSDNSISTNIERKIDGQIQIEKKHGNVLSDKRLANHHYSRGFLYMDDGSRSRAISEFLQAIQLNPLYPWYYYHLFFSFFGTKVFQSSLYLKKRVKILLYGSQ